MKRALAILLVVCLIISFTFILGGCSRKHKCEECGRVETLKTIEFDGEKYHLCKDCYTIVEGLKELASIFG